MRTLKKTLALVLVIAMVFSLCAMSVSAADAYKDDKDIENKLAVYALTEMGVLNGMDGENFAPNGNFTRAQAAKIIAYLRGDGAEAAKKTSTDFADVDKDYWASGYIAYCANLGIVEGYGDGTYGPDDALTGYQWLKMLICALGYNATVEGLNGVGWDVMTALKAADLGLVKGIETLNKRNVIAREDAAQAAFNALEVGNVYYEDASFIPGTTYGDCYYTGYDFLDLLGYTMDFGFKADAYGRPATAQWTVTKKVADAKPVVVLEEATDYTEYTAATKVADVVKTLAKGAVVDTNDITASENGDILRLYDLNEYKAYGNYGYEFHLVKVHAYKLGLTDVVPAGLNTKAYIKLDGTYKFETSAFAAGDVVLYTVNAKDAVETAVKAAYAAGEITNVKDVNGITVFYVNDELKALHGDAHDYVSKTNDVLDINDIINYYADADEYNFYTDEYGYVVAIANIPNEFTYIGYLTDYEARAGGPGDDYDLIGNVNLGKTYVEKYEIVTTDNEVVVLDGLTYNAQGKANGFVGILDAAGNKVAYDNTKDLPANIHGLVEYTVDKTGKVTKVVLAPESDDYGFKTGMGTLGNWAADNVTYNAAETELVTAATVGFIYTVDELTGDVTAKAYTGYQAIPSFYAFDQYILNTKTDANNNYKAFSSNSEYLHAAIVTDYVFVASEKYTQPAQAVGYVNIYDDVYIDGKLDTISFFDLAELKNAIQEYTDFAAYKAPNLYKVTYNANGYVDAADAAVDYIAPYNETVYEIQNTYFKTTGNTGKDVIYFDDATAFYQIVATEKADKSGYTYSVKAVDALQALANDIIVRATYVINEDKVVDLAAEAVYFTVSPVEEPEAPVYGDAITVPSVDAYVDHATGLIYVNLTKTVDEQKAAIVAALEAEGYTSVSVAVKDGKIDGAITAQKNGTETFKLADVKVTTDGGMLFVHATRGKNVSGDITLAGVNVADIAAKKLNVVLYAGDKAICECVYAKDDLTAGDMTAAWYLGKYDGSSWLKNEFVANPELVPTTVKVYVYGVEMASATGINDVELDALGNPVPLTAAAWAEFIK